MPKFKHIDTILKNRPEAEQVTYIPKNLELIEGCIKLRATPNLFLLENLQFQNDVEIQIVSKTEIEIKHCTFDGALFITPKPESELDGISVRLFKTIVNSHINFNRLGNYKNASIDCCLTGTVNFSDQDIDYIDIYFSEIDEVYFEGTIVKELSILDSFIKRILHNGLDSKSINIDLKSVMNHYRKFNKIRVESFVNDQYIDECKEEIKKFKKHIKSEKSPSPKKSFSEFKTDMINNILITKESIAQSKNDAVSYYCIFR